MVESTPLKPKKNTFAMKTDANLEWTIWENVIVDEGRDIKMKELLDILSERYHVEVCFLSFGSHLVYSFFHKKDLITKLNTPVSQLAQIDRDTYPFNFIMLGFMAESLEFSDDNSELPDIKYVFR